jgi:hypothetical protein
VAEVEELPAGRPRERVIDEAAVATLIARAGRLTRSEARALANAAAWQWQPLTLPIRGSFAAARSEALAAARAAGRGELAVGAMEDAARAALDSPVGGSIGRRWSWAENGLAAVLIGGMGAIVGATNGLQAFAFAFGLLAVVGGMALLRYDTARATRRRLEAAVGSAALALVVRDLVSPETAQALRGPWSTVMHD